jgi:hypothetical protein
MDLKRENLIRNENVEINEYVEWSKEGDVKKVKDKGNCG